MPTPEYTVRTYQLGEKVELGRLEYNVYESQWRTHLGEGPGSRIPDNRYFLVRISVTNHGSTDLIVPTMSLADAGGATYSELAGGDQVPQWMGLLRRVRPGHSLQGNVVFDCPPKRYNLRLADETEVRTANVDIPLTFGAETPEIPSPQMPQTK